MSSPATAARNNLKTRIPEGSSTVSSACNSGYCIPASVTIYWTRDRSPDPVNGPNIRPVNRDQLRILGDGFGHGGLIFGPNFAGKILRAEIQVVHAMRAAEFRHAPVERDYGGVVLAIPILGWQRRRERMMSGMEIGDSVQIGDDSSAGWQIRHDPLIRRVVRLIDSPLSFRRLRHKRRYGEDLK